MAADVGGFDERVRGVRSGGHVNRIAKKVSSVKGNEAREVIDIGGTYDINDDGKSLKSIGTYQANGAEQVDLLVRCSQD